MPGNWRQGHDGNRKKLSLPGVLQICNVKGWLLMQHHVPRGPYRVRTTITRLAAVREQARLTQMQLAALAGVSERAIRQHESLVRIGDVWQATQKRLIGVCVQEIERRNRDFGIVITP